MEADLSKRVFQAKNFLEVFLKIKKINYSIEQRGGGFYEVVVINGLTGFFGLDKENKLRFMVTNSGLKNWAHKEGINPDSAEYSNLKLLLELDGEINFAKFLAGDSDYKILSC